MIINHDYHLEDYIVQDDYKATYEKVSDKISVNLLEKVMMVI